MSLTTRPLELTGALPRRAAGLAIVGLLLPCSPASAGEPCIPQWAAEKYCLQGIDFGGQQAIGNAMAVFDDGTGPALYLGGSFFRAGCSDEVRHIVKWDGVQFTPLVGANGSVGVSSVGAARVNAMTVFNDGNGPALYIAGEFTTAGGVLATNIARWDGVSFSRLGGEPNSPTFINGEILAMCPSPDGSSLIVGGDFTTIGAVGTVNRIARWDGAEWSSFESAGGIGVGGTVRALTTFDDGGGTALYAAGNFTSASGVSVNRVAKWTGGGWEQLAGPSGVGVDVTAFSLATHDDGSGMALYIGGNFITAGGITVNRIARWNGTTWSALTAPGGVGVSGTVRAMATYDDGDGSRLYAAGDMTTAGGVTVNRLAGWDGANWSAATGPWATGVTTTINALALHDDGAGAGPALYATGTFASAGGLYASQSARWNGDEWSVLVSPQVSGVTTPTSNVWTTLVFDDGDGEALYFGGAFTNVAGQLVNRVARWDGESYAALSGPDAPGMNAGLVYALAAYDDGDGAAIYAGGTFTASGGVTTNRIAMWDGTHWSALSGPNGIGVNSSVWSMAVYDDGSGPALFVGGEFVTAGGITVNRIAKWNGATWSALEGPNGVGLTSASGTTAAYAMTVFDDGTGPALYVAGRFSHAGGETANHIAKWDGSAWAALETRDGIGIDTASGTTNVRALAVYDDGSGPALYVGGSFLTIGGATVNRIARWDGAAWTTVESSGQIGTSGLLVYSLHVHDHGDGNGPGLYAGGNFLTAGGQTVNRIARWDGTNWTPLDGPDAPGIGLTSDTVSVFTMSSFDDGSGDGLSLFAGGDFLTAGGVASRFLAKWTGCGGASPAIPGDFNGDGVVDGADLGVLLFSWGPCVPKEPCPADLNGDGVVDGADLGILLFNWS